MADVTYKPARERSRPAAASNLAQVALRAAKTRPTQLAGICGVSVKSASRWLRGEKMPDDDHAAAIAQALGIPAHYWRLTPALPGTGHVTNSPVFLDVKRSDPRPVARALPADWPRRPGETRTAMFQRRINWSHAALLADQQNEAPPPLTTLVDVAAVEQFREAMRRRRAVDGAA